LNGLSIQKKRPLISIPWNLLLITTGTPVLRIGVKAIVVPQVFITGGISGVGLLAYFSDSLSPGS